MKPGKLNRKARRFAICRKHAILASTFHAANLITVDRAQKEAICLLAEMLCLYDKGHLPAVSDRYERNVLLYPLYGREDTAGIWTYA